MSDHQRWSEDCSFVRDRNGGDVPIEVDSNPMSSAGRDTCEKYGIEISPNSFPEREAGSTNNNKLLNLTKLGVQPNRGPAHAGYVTLEQRLNSFACWGRSIKQRPEELATAGFFYNGKGDQTICFHCGGGLKEWEDEDSPWEQHAKWFSKCNFVVLQKDPEYISEICSKEEEAVLAPDEAADLQIPPATHLNIAPVNHPKIESNSSPSTSELTVTKPKEIEPKELTSEHGKASNTSTLCKICYAKEMGVVFLPCGHIIACVDCVLALTMCVVCRKPLEATVRVFLQ